MKISLFENHYRGLRNLTKLDIRGYSHNLKRLLQKFEIRLFENGIWIFELSRQDPINRSKTLFLKMWINLNVWFDWSSVLTKGTKLSKSITQSKNPQFKKKWFSLSALPHQAYDFTPPGAKSYAWWGKAEKENRFFLNCGFLAWNLKKWY